MLCVMLLMSAALFGCGGGKDQPGGSQGGQEVSYKDALDVLNQVLAVYGEEDRFAMYGGDQENAVMDAPGKFDISKTEELKMNLGLPESQIASVDDAASMIHMMNANTFTGAAYHLKDGSGCLCRGGKDQYFEHAVDLRLSRYAAHYQCRRRLCDYSIRAGGHHGELQDKGAVCP